MSPIALVVAHDRYRYVSLFQPTDRPGVKCPEGSGVGHPTGGRAFLELSASSQLVPLR